MNRIKSYRYLFYRKETYFSVGFWLLMGMILFTNTVHESYPDEFDNILGGWYTLHGRFLYSGFFTHHNPIAYWLSALIELFSGQSFVRFRLVYALFLFGYLLWLYIFLKRRFPEVRLGFYLCVLLLFGIGATYFWGHMLLADNLAALFLMPVFVFLIVKEIYAIRMRFADIIFISILASLALLSAMTYSFLIALLYAYTLYLYFKDNRVRITFKSLSKVIFVFAFPYVLFIIYLLLTGSLSDYVYQGIVFNQKFYIYNYPRPEGGVVNPIRYAIVIAQEFFNNFTSVLITAKDFNFSFPFNSTLAVVNTAFLIYLLLKRQFILAFVSFLFLIYANVRTNPLSSSERDYQSSVYILFSFVTMSFFLTHVYEELNTNILYGKRLVFSFLILLVGVYVFFNTSFLLRKYIEKTYNKYMGMQPLIYDRPEIAPVISSAIEKDEYMWIGPFAFENLFYTRGNVPSKYSIFLPEFAKSPKIQSEMMDDFVRNKPVVIYFDKQYSIRGYMPEKYGQFFLDYLSANYMTLLDYREGKKKYVSTRPITPHLDIETKLFIRKDKRDVVIRKLIDNGYLKETM